LREKLVWVSIPYRDDKNFDISIGEGAKEASFNPL